jgi:hypothetical protein
VLRRCVFGLCRFEFLTGSNLIDPLGNRSFLILELVTIVCNVVNREQRRPRGQTFYIFFKLL